MNEEAIIQTSNLTKKYGKKIAVNGLDLSIRKGEVFGLLGPNGAGKTTTILMMLGLTEPTEGSVTIDGMDCTRNAIEVKHIVGYMPDNIGFYTDLTGRENLRFTGRLNGLQGKDLEDRIDMLLKRVGMEKDADRKTGTYSRGMKQRLGIADVLMKDPKIIIMDEPTLGIDPEGMRELLVLIRQLAEEDGRTLLLSSHQLQQVQKICDRVGIFVNGSLIASGAIDSLSEQVQARNSYTIELKVEPMDGKLKNCLDTMVNQGAEITINQDMILIKAFEDFRKPLTEFLVENGYTILHLRRCGDDLDEIYHMFFEKEEKKIESSNRKEKKK